MLLSYFFAKGYLRQEENLFLSIPRDVVLKMDRDMQALIGYEASGKHELTGTLAGDSKLTADFKILTADS